MMRYQNSIKQQLYVSMIFCCNQQANKLAVSKCMLKARLYLSPANEPLVAHQNAFAKIIFTLVIW